MKTSPTLIKTLAAAAAMLAFAGAARADGAEFMPPQPQPPSTLTRAQVRAELLAAIASGELRWLNGEHHGFYQPFMPKRMPAETRMAEGKAATETR